MALIGTYQKTITRVASADDSLLVLLGQPANTETVVPIPNVYAVIDPYQGIVGGKGGIQAVIAIYTDAGKAQHIDNRYIEFVPTMDSNFICQAYREFAQTPVFAGFVSDELD